MRRKIIIALEAEGDDELVFLVCPANQHQVEDLGAALAGAADTQKMFAHFLRTFKEVTDTRTATPEDIAKAMAILREPNRVLGEQIDYVRTLLGRAVLCTGRPEQRKGRLQ